MDPDEAARRVAGIDPEVSARAFAGIDVITTVQRWHRAVWVDGDADTARALMHPWLVQRAGVDLIGSLRAALPDLATTDILIGLPQAESPDTENVLLVGGSTSVRVVVLHLPGGPRVCGFNVDPSANPVRAGGE